MNSASDAWSDVASKVESLGLKLKLHLEQEQSDDVGERAEGDTRGAFDDLADGVTSAFDAFGNAARDEGVRTDVREIAELIKEALIETFRAVGAEVGDLIDQIEDYAEDAAETIAEKVGIDIDLDDEDSDAKPTVASDGEASPEA